MYMHALRTPEAQISTHFTLRLACYNIFAMFHPSIGHKVKFLFLSVFESLNFKIPRSNACVDSQKTCVKSRLKDNRYWTNRKYTVAKFVLKCEGYQRPSNFGSCHSAINRYEDICNLSISH